MKTQFFLLCIVGAVLLLSIAVPVSALGAPCIASINPWYAYNDASVTGVVITGTGFNVTSSLGKVILMMNGKSNITATVTAYSTTSLTCTFPISGVTAGYWDVVVVNRDLQEDVLSQGFRIRSAITLTSVSPTSAQTNTRVEVTVVGTGLSDIESMYLYNADYDNITADITSQTSTKVIGTFNLNDADIDTYTICVEDSFGTIKCGLDFEIVSDQVCIESKIGVVRNNKTWILDASGNGAYGAGDRIYTFGTVGDRYVTGDWNGNGTTKIGVVRNNKTWILDASGNGMYGAGDLIYTFGKAEDVYVTGDWNGNGTTKIGVVRNNNTWLLDASGDGKWGLGDYQYTFGKAGDVYVTGDWNNDRKTEIGVVRNNKTWILDASGDGKYGAGDIVYNYGRVGDRYVTGDWNGNGTTKIGVVRTNTTWLLDAFGNGQWGPGDYQYTFGKAGDKYVTGKWN